MTPKTTTESSPKLNVAPRKNRKATAPLQIVFLGLAVTEHEDKSYEYFLAVHDGVGLVQSEHNRLPGPWVSMLCK